jgi:hypothetical protein
VHASQIPKKAGENVLSLVGTEISSERGVCLRHEYEKGYACAAETLHFDHDLVKL